MTSYSGSTRGASSALKDRAEMVGAGDVIINGLVFHELMLNYLSLLDVTVLASRDEGCPSVVLEA